MSKSRSFTRSVLQFGLWGILCLIVLLIFLLIGVRWAVTNERTHSFIEERIKQISVAGQQIEIGGLEGDLLDHFKVQSLRIRDRNGVWLESDGIGFDWTMSSLLVSREFDISALHADRLYIARRPYVESSENKSKGESPIHALRLKSLDLPRIEFGKALVGRDAVFSSKGALNVSQSEGDIELQITPERPGGDNVRIVAGWSPDQPLLGQLEASGPPGGLFAELLQLAPDANPSLTINAKLIDGGVDSKVELRVSEVPVVSAAGVWQNDRLHADVQAVLDGFAVADSVSDRIGGRLAVNAVSKDANTVAITLTTPVIKSTFEIPFDHEKRAANLDSIQLTASTRDFKTLTGLDSIQIGALNLKGLLTRSGRDVAFDGDYSLQSIVVNDVKAKEVTGPVAIDYGIESKKTDIKSVINIQDFELPSPEAMTLIGIAPRIDIAASFDQKTGEVKVAPSRINYESGAITTSGFVSAGANVIQLNGRVDVSPPAPFGSVELASLTGKWSFGRPSADEAFNFTIDGMVDGLVLSDNYLAPQLEQGLSYTVDLETIAGGIDLNSMAVAGNGLKLDAAGRFTQSDIQANLKGEITGLKVATSGAESVSLDAAVSGALDALSFDAGLEAIGLVGGGQNFDAAGLNVRGNYTDGKLNAVTNIDTRWRDQPVIATTKISLTKDDWAADDLRFAWGPNSINGTLSGQGGDIASVRADLDFTTQPTDDGVPLSLKGGIRLADETISSEVTFGSIAGGAVELEGGELTVEGNIDDAKLTLKTTGILNIADISHPLKLDLDSTVAVSERMALANIDAAIGPSVIKSSDHVELKFGDTEKSAIGSLTLFGGETRFDLRQGISSESISVNWTTLDLGELAALISYSGLNGKSTGEIALQSDGKPASGDIGVNLSGITIEDANDLALDIDITGTLSGQELTSQLVAAGAGLNINVDAVAPLNNSGLVSQIRTDPDAPVAIKADGAGPVEALWSFFGPPDSRLVGVVDLDASATGSLSNLKPSGKFEFSGGEYEDSQIGVFLKGIQLTAIFDESGVTLDSLDAEGGDGGTLTGTGQYAFDGNGDAVITLAGFSALQRSDVSLTLSGDLMLAQRNENTKISGGILIDDARIDIGQLQGGGYAVMSVDFAGDSDGKKGNSRAAMPIEIDIDVKGAQKMYVTGKGVDTEWGTDLNIGGSLNKPYLLGDVRLLRGNMKFSDREFVFEESAIRFDGDPLAGQLDIRARREVSDFTAELLVQGLVGEPKIELRSEPVMSEDEVLSRVLFGRSPTELTAIEAAKLGAAASSIARGKGFDLTSPVKEFLNVDRLGFGLNEEGDATVTTGKYLSEDVYLELRSDSSGAPGFDVEWTPRGNLEIGAEVEPEENPKFRLRWKRDYDTGR